MAASPSSSAIRRIPVLLSRRAAIVSSTQSLRQAKLRSPLFLAVYSIVALAHGDPGWLSTPSPERPVGRLGVEPEWRPGVVVGHGREAAAAAANAKRRALAQRCVAS